MNGRSLAFDTLKTMTVVRSVWVMPTATDIGTLVSCSLDSSGGRPMVAGTRTPVSRIAVLYQQGAGAEEIASRLPHLSLAQVYAALAYYHANLSEIEAELAEEEAEYWRLAASHIPKA